MPDPELVMQVHNTCQPFCAALTKEEVAQFVTYTKEIHLKPEQVLADIGEIGDSFYMVLEGNIGLYQVEKQREFKVGEITPGGLVGEMSFFDRQPRTIRLKVCSQTTRLLEINRQMYHRLRIQEPYISTNLLEFIIRSLDELVRTLGQQNADLHSVLNEREPR